MSEEEDDPILVEDDLKSRSLGKPILYKSRWHMLTIYSSSCSQSNCVGVLRRTSFSRSVIFSRTLKKISTISITQAIPTATEHRFNVNTTSVNFLAMVFPILFFPGLLLASVTMEKYSLRGTMLIASIMMAVGCVVRFAGSVLPSSLEHESFALILIGQSIVALAQPFVVESSRCHRWTMVRCQRT